MYVYMCVYMCVCMYVCLNAQGVLKKCYPPLFEISFLDSLRMIENDFMLQKKDNLEIKTKSDHP